MEMMLFILRIVFAVDMAFLRMAYDLITLPLILPALASGYAAFLAIQCGAVASKIETLCSRA